MTSVKEKFQDILHSSTDETNIQNTRQKSHPHTESKVSQHCQDIDSHGVPKPFQDKAISTQNSKRLVRFSTLLLTLLNQVDTRVQFIHQFLPY